MESDNSSYYFSTRDLVTIAVLSALGGALSTYVGYLGQLLNAALGTPFGAGQFLSGLHVFWIILAAGLVRKPGAATSSGFLKGFIEFFTGSTHGILIVLVSLIQGIIVDIGISAVRNRDSLPLYCLVGGFSAASNILVFQLFYFSGAPLLFITLLVILAFASGIIFAGYFGHATVTLINSTQLMRTTQNETNSTSSSFFRRTFTNPYRLSAVIFLIAIAFGASLYGVFVWRPVLNPHSLDITGQVANPYRFSYSTFASHEITIEAELIGSVTHIPPRNYTGISLAFLIQTANPLPSATTVQVIASDGYSVAFALEDVLNDSELIISIDDGLRLVAKNYPGEFWVKKVVTLVIS